MRLLVLMLLVGCEKEKPVPPLGTGPIPCTVESHVLQRKEAAAFLKAGNLDAAHELLFRQTCGPDEEMSVELLEHLTWVDVARAEVSYLFGDFEGCHDGAASQTMPDGYYSKYFERSHPVIKAFEELAQRCEGPLAKERSLFTPAPRCAYKTGQSSFRLPDEGCLVFETCGDSYLDRQTGKTKLTIDRGNLVESACHNVRAVSFGRGEILVTAGGRGVDDKWWPYSRHVYKLDGTTLAFVRAVRTPADLEAR
jgi:hypothetical protein